MLPFYYINLINVVTSYLADSDFQWLYIMIHYMLPIRHWVSGCCTRAKAVHFLISLLYLQCNTKINHANNPQYAEYPTENAFHRHRQACLSAANITFSLAPLQAHSTYDWTKVDQSVGQTERRTLAFLEPCHQCGYKSQRVITQWLLHLTESHRLMMWNSVRGSERSSSPWTHRSTRGGFTASECCLASESGRGGI